MGRAEALAVALPLASLPFLLPHVIEDFRWGIAERVGLPADVLASLVGFALAAQLLGAALAAQRRALGLGIVAATAAVWAVGGRWDHGFLLVLFGMGFRGSALSADWALGLITTQGAAAACALVALRRVLRSDHMAETTPRPCPR